MAQSVMQRIQELSEERERLVGREGAHHAGEGDRARLEQIDHDSQVLWDLRRRELAGEQISLDEDYYDSYTRYTDADDPPGR